MRKKPIETSLVEKHVLVPKHSKCSEKETKEVLEQFNCTKQDLPKILVTDPAIRDKDFDIGDVVKIKRNSPTSGTSLYYRVIVNA